MRRLCIAIIAAGLLLAAARPADAAPPTWYPALRWSPATPENYEPGRAGARVSMIVIHATQGSYAGAVSWFRDPRARLSAHYVIRARDGEITQLVAESDTAFHVRGLNRTTIGIEHEFDPARGIGYTDAEYRSSAALVCAIARRYGFPADRAHIRGHSELPGTDHTDPGPTWDWASYLSFVSACAGSPAATAAAPPLGSGTDAGVTPCPNPRCVPDAGLGEGATGAAVSLLQTDLAALGRMTQATVLSGGGRFGPRTVVAVRSFQEANGLPATGFYGPLTAAALARSLARVPTSAAGAVLVLGARSAAVTQLQRDLGRLGYLDAVTGYYGPATRDAVRRFQRDHGIMTTGNYGPLTQASMASMAAVTAARR